MQNLGQIKSQLEDVQKQFDQYVAQHVEPFSTMNIQVNDVSNVFNGIKYDLEKCLKEPSSVFIYKINQAFNQLKQTTANLPGNNHPQFIESLFNLSDLTSQLLRIPETASKATGRQLEDLLKGHLKSFETTEKQAQKIKSLYNDAQGSARQLEEVKTTMHQLHEAIKAVHNSATERINEINNNNTLSTNLKTSMEKTSKKIQEDLQRQKEIMDFFEEKRSEIENTLAAANRIGLAKSFDERMKSASYSKIGWALAFFACLAGLVCVSISFIWPTIQKSFENNIPFDFWSILTRVIITSPLIWGAWFSARQYGFASRIYEDYSYKVATALSFEGFKKEAREMSKDMEAELIKVAITNFGQNPVRIFESNKNHASPLHELFGRHNHQSDKN